MTITSLHNSQLKEIRKLTQRKRDRERTGRFVAEGEDLLTAADAAGWEPIVRLCASGTGLLGLEVEADLLASVSGLASGTRTVAIYEQRWVPAPVGPLCVYLHGVRDPGNVGTIMRSASAFGASSVVAGPDCADPFGPKAVRASMGAVFELALARASDISQLPGRTVALVADRGRPLSEVDLNDVTLMIGAERAGLPADLSALAGEVARIPIQSHSLNAAMAATVALYEATRMAR